MDSRRRQRGQTINGDETAEDVIEAMRWYGRKLDLQGPGQQATARMLKMFANRLERVLDREWVADENTSDGYHTFKELYRYRMLYNAAFFNLAHRNGIQVVKSHLHSDGKPCFGGGWFIVMAQLPTGQISNHYEDRYWNLFHIPAVRTAPEWDGHSPNDAADRLELFIRQG